MRELLKAINQITKTNVYYGRQQNRNAIEVKMQTTVAIHKTLTELNCLCADFELAEL
jgi:hypothetical protein